MTTDEIRQKYLDFFAERGHKVIPRANLVPQEDPTTLFTGSGMQPLLPYLLGESHPDGTKLTDSQPSFRAEDIDEIGDNRHTTFFEMLGNWSLGDYFKEEQLAWFWEFLTKELQLDPAKLYVTVFAGDDKNGIPKDTESAEIWQKLYKQAGIDAKTVENAEEAGMQDGRIFFYKEDNWWSRVLPAEDMPPGEPGGPDSEVFYEFSDVEHDEAYGKVCHPNCDCGRFLEIGNSVFMQYVRTENGFEELPNKNVDFGGGLERLAAAVNGDPDVFKIDGIWPIVEKLSELTGKQYEDHVEAKRVIADHMRAAVFLATDGVRPSNTAQGYVLRRLLRRAIRKGLELDVHGDLFKQITPTVVGIYESAYPEVREQGAEVTEVLTKEESLFRQTLRRGLKEFDKITGTRRTYVEKSGGFVWEGDEKGSDPIVLSKNYALKGKDIFLLYDTYGFPPELSLEEAESRGIKVDKNWQSDFEAELEKQRERSRTATKGEFKGGLGGHSEMHKKYHTATHLMYKALRMVLGDHVVQRGSNVTDERLRFDFSHPEKMTDEEKQQVEDIVNEQIEKDLQVSWEEIPTEEALDKGAFGAFGDKYGDKVKVYTMTAEGEEPFSFEICGGPHVEHTGQLAEGGKKFKIKKEESSSAGVRRIKAMLE